MCSASRMPRAIRFRTAARLVFQVHVGPSAVQSPSSAAVSNPRRHAQVLHRITRRTIPRQWMQAHPRITRRAKGGMEGSQKRHGTAVDEHGQQPALEQGAAPRVGAGHEDGSSRGSLSIEAAQSGGTKAFPASKTWAVADEGTGDAAGAEPGIAVLAQAVIRRICSCLARVWHPLPCP